jgi:serine/threonine-protein kinase
VDHRADVWSFGVLVLEALTGRLPFVGETPYALVGEILYGPTPDVRRLLKRFDPRLGDLVAGCIVRDLGQRLSSMSEVARRLEAVIASPASGAVGAARHAASDVPAAADQGIEADPTEPDPGSKYGDATAVMTPFALASDTFAAAGGSAPWRKRRRVGLAVLGAAVVATLAVGYALSSRQGASQPGTPVAAATSTPGPSPSPLATPESPVSAAPLADVEASPAEPASAQPSVAQPRPKRRPPPPARPPLVAEPPSPPPVEPAPPAPRSVAIPDSPG